MKKEGGTFVLRVCRTDVQYFIKSWSSLCDRTRPCHDNLIAGVVIAQSIVHVIHAISNL